MPNPYHDSQGRFCSKGEMVADIRRLATENDYPAYAKLRAEYDQIVRDAGMTSHERKLDELDNQIRVRVKTDTLENTQASFNLVEPALKDKNDFHSFAASLLESEHTTPEQRKEVLENVNEMDLRDVLERDFHFGKLTETDYQVILGRADADRWKPLFAKHPALSYEKKRELVGDDDWGLSMLALHSTKEFFADSKAVAELREHATVGENPANFAYEQKSYTKGGEYTRRNPYIIESLAHSPYEEDHLTVINSPHLQDGFITPGVTLARNETLSLGNSVELLQRARDTNDRIGWVARTLGDRYLTEKQMQAVRTGKTKASVAPLTGDDRAKITAEIETLREHPENGLNGSPSNERIRVLTGRLYASDKDYQQLVRGTLKTGLASGLFNRQKTVLPPETVYKLRAAEDYRESEAVLYLLKEKLNK